MLNAFNLFINKTAQLGVKRYALGTGVSVATQVAHYHIFKYFHESNGYPPIDPFITGENSDSLDEKKVAYQKT